MENNCDWKTATPSEISYGLSPQCLRSFYTKSDEGSQAKYLVTASDWTWPKTDSSAVCAGYLNAVVTSH